MPTQSAGLNVTMRVLLKRVRDHLESQNRSQEHAKGPEVDEVMEEMLARWPEYQRRTKMNFRSMVSKALATVATDAAADSDERKMVDAADMGTTEAAELVCASHGNGNDNANGNGSGDGSPVRKKAKMDADQLQKCCNAGTPRGAADAPGGREVRTANAMYWNQSAKTKQGGNGVPGARQGGARSRATPSAAKRKPGGSREERRPQCPQVRYSQMGGIEEQLAVIDEIIARPLRHPELYSWLGVSPPRGVLLHGPHGCGKTLLAHAIGTECGVPFYSIAAPEIASGLSGDSEARLRRLFADAHKHRPSIVFIDEIDAIAMRRDASNRSMESRIVAQLLSCMDQLGTHLDGSDDTTQGKATPTQPGAERASGHGSDGTGDRCAAGDEGEDDAAGVANGHRRGHVVVIGATSRPDALDPALRRAGRASRGSPAALRRIHRLARRGRRCGRAGSARSGAGILGARGAVRLRLHRRRVGVLVRHAQRAGGRPR